ncbi:YidB family protein [Daeguia caeni]|uniref:YidB family protein n=1 Tax=Daeguia caeni TaxID=439612 RepID=A0ABV9H4L4_9HYPH
MTNYDGSNSPIPGGSLAKPVMIALGALLIGKMLSGKHEDQPAPDQQQSTAGGGLLGSILGGLGGLLGGAAASNAATAPGALGGGLLDQLKQAGLGDKVDSWLGQGENHPIEPEQLGNALGQQTLNDIAAHAGIDPQELGHLSQVLPGLVDQLTANGQVPDASEIARMLQGR